MRHRREAEHVADVGERERAVAQAAADVQGSVARDPVVGGQAAGTLRHLAQVLRRDTQFVGIVSNLAVLAEVAVLEHLDELFHQLVLLRRDAVHAIERGVEVEEIENHRLDGRDEDVAVELMLGLRQALTNDGEVIGTHALLLGRQTHDGVLEQRQVAPHAIVALWRAHLDKLLRDIDDLDCEVVAGLAAEQVAAAGNDHAVAGLQRELAVVIRQPAMAAVAVGMAQIAGQQRVGHPVQGVVEDDVLYKFHSVLSHEHFVDSAVGHDDVGAAG